MAISVRVNPLLEKELELAAKRQGITKSQFVVRAIERALGRKNPHELMLKLIAEEEAMAKPAVEKAFVGYEQPYSAASARAFIKKKLKDKHGVGRAG
jgi:predicted DNA-binding protein